MEQNLFSFLREDLAIRSNVKSSCLSVSSTGITDMYQQAKQSYRILNKCGPERKKKKKTQTTKFVKIKIEFVRAGESVWWLRTLALGF